jgi:PAS domain S-box-containing protein
MAKRRPSAGTLRVREEALLQMLADGVDEVLWFSTPHPEQVLYVSPAFEQVWGCKAADLYAHPQLWTESILEEDRDEAYRAFSQWIEGSAAKFDVEFRIRRQSDDEVRWISDRGVFIRQFDGTTVVGGIAEDITELKQLESERENLLGRLQQALQFRDEFISLASHELRTPLTPLKLSLLTMDKLKGQPSRDWDRLILVALDQVRRLEVLMNNLLDASQIRTGRFQVQREETNLSELLESIVAAHRHWIESSGARIRTRIQPDVIGSFDRMRIEQIVVNLLTNAMKYAPGSTIDLELEQLDGSARLVVRDHGPGIAPEFLAKLFQSFSRAPESSRASGLGLGLYLCRRISEAHGGSIRAENVPDGGARFELLVPVRHREQVAA